MITIGIDTSTPNAGVALLDDGRLIFHESFLADRSHSSHLFASLERANAIAKPAQIAVGLGPGSYAGVRIAIAAATGLSLATGARLLGIPSVATLDDGEYLAIGDARQSAFYFAHVRDNALLEGPRLLDCAELEARLASNALPLYASESLAFENVLQRYPDARRLVKLAAEGRSISARNALEPIYLRDPHITTPKTG